MRHGSLFSGIGGFDLAAEWMGWENVFHCEWMEFPRKVLDYYFSNADSHIDICKTDFKKYEGTIDIISGGFPCQPFSLAGKRKGTEDERFLWHEMLRAIQEIKPKFVIAENVFGITNIDGGMVFEQVCVDLETQGYEVQPFIIPSASKNAPHVRQRVWFIAYTLPIRLQQCKDRTKMGRGQEEICREGSKSTNGIETDGKISNATDTNGIRLERRLHSNGREREISAYNVTTFNTPFSRRTWENFPTEPPICGGDDGLPTELDGITFSKWRAESIKGYGNAIVPQVAYELFKIISKL
jgi:DNA (cytosine-5)-methyltransferase 1